MLAPSRSRARRYLLQARCLPGRRRRRSITADGHFAEAAMRHCTECTCNRILRQRNSTLASERHHRALPSAMIHRSWNVGPAVRRSGGPAVRRRARGQGQCFLLEWVYDGRLRMPAPAAISRVFSRRFLWMQIPPARGPAVRRGGPEAAPVRPDRATAQLRTGTSVSRAGPEVRRSGPVRRLAVVRRAPDQFISIHLDVVGPGSGGPVPGLVRRKGSRTVTTVHEWLHPART